MSQFVNNASSISPVTFVSAVKCSRLISSALNEYNNHEISCKLFSKILPVLIKSFRRNKEIKSLINKLIFMCMMDHYQNKECYKQFEEIMDSTQQIIKEYETTPKPTDSKHKLTNYFHPISKKYTTNILNRLPNDILSKSMSYIDALELAKLETISFKFLECARQPIAITFSKLFFEKTHQMDQNYQIMQRYMNLRNVSINSDTLTTLISKAKKSIEFGIEPILSFIHLDEKAVKILFDLITETHLRDNEGIKIHYLDINILRSLKYLDSSEYVAIIIHDSSFAEDRFMTKYQIINHIHEIRESVQHLSDIYIQFILDDMDNNIPIFEIFAAICHTNIKHLNFEILSCDSNTYHFEYNDQMFIPQMNNLQSLRIRSISDTEQVELIKAGKCFMKSLLNKITNNTLQSLELWDWYHSWCNINLLKDFILNHYQTLSSIKCSLEDEYSDVELHDIETWKPIIIIHELIKNKHQCPNIDHWLNNVFQTFEFDVGLCDPIEMDYALREYIENFKKYRYEKLENLNVKINECINFFVEHNIDWSIRINCGSQYNKYEEWEQLDPLAVYQEFFIHSTVNWYYDTIPILEFHPISPQQTMITDYFH